MKKIFLIFILAISLTACSERAIEQLTIVSYNVRNGAGMDDVRNYDRTSTVITKCAPDIVALQEIDSMTARSNQTDVLSVIANQTALHPSFARAINYDGGAYGVGMLSKQKPLKTTRIPLPGREEERVLIVAEFDKYVFCATHFSLTTEDQITSLRMLDSVTRHYQKPVFVAGDLNFQPTDKQFLVFSERFSILSPIDQATYPADEPSECIDYIAVRRVDSCRVRVISSEVVNAPIESDHRPLRLEIAF